ncbi:CHAT domain-containing protein [Streptomyces cyanogenus]|nr:CHAT domain-containing protein [Streptomyces cyanogenus]
MRSAGADTGDEPDLGPLMALHRDVHSGSLDLDAAKQRAAEHGARGEVTAQLAIALSQAAVRASDETWRGALPGAELAYEAMRAGHRARPDDPAMAEAWVATGADLVEVLHRGLIEHGDLRLYLRATGVADDTVRAAGDLGLPRLQGLVSLRLGLLLLDAYTAGRSPVGYDSQFVAWMDKALQANDPDLQFLVSRPITPDGEADQSPAPASWPPPLEALDRAETHLREALPLIIPERRGRALKALAQAIEWRGWLGGERNDDELRSVAEQALRELDPDDTQPRLALAAMLQRLGHSGHGDALDHDLRDAEQDWASFRARTEPATAWDILAQGASYLQETDPERALRLLARQRELPELWADDLRRSRHFHAVLSLFAEAHRPDWAQAAWDGDIEGTAGRAIAAAAEAASPEDAREAAAALLTVMLATTRPGVDREEEGLELVDTLFGLDAALWAEHEEAVHFLVAGLLRGAGVNRMHAGDVDDAGRYYRAAADGFRELAMPVPMVQCLEYLDDVVRAGTTTLDELTAWLAAHSLTVELAAPGSAPAAVHRLATHLLAGQVSAGTSAEVVQLLLQVIKGRRFAAMLAEGTRDFRLDERTRSLLGLAAEAEAALSEDSDILRPEPFDAALGDDDLLTAWVDEYEKGPSQTPEDRLAGLQRAVERRLSAALLPTSAPHLVPLAEIQRRLDSRTALLLLFEGAGVDGNVTMGQLLITRDFEYAAIGTEQMPAGTIRMSDRGRTVTVPASGVYVGALRRAIHMSDPGPFDVTPQAAQDLAGAADRYARAVNNCRDRLTAAGVDHLVVVPHGAGRYVPVHLVGPPGHPLADDWTVTYLSNLAQLFADPRPAPPRDGVGVFALSYTDQPELPRLDDSVDEARTIADVCGTTALVDAAATEAAFTRALETRRYVHLRAHGRLYVDAPSFHTVFLHPARGPEGHDGRLRAYEILPLDVTGLELVTLGACETALGRVDQYDNPRGLPAALLLAGARAVVGTLWPVLASASTYFFAELYRGLLHDDLDVPTAFRAAQRATRTRFPAYRDWGAFYLVGGLTRESTA